MKNSCMYGIVAKRMATEMIADGRYRDTMMISDGDTPPGAYVHASVYAPNVRFACDIARDNFDILVSDAVEPYLPPYDPEDEDAAYHDRMNDEYGKDLYHDSLDPHIYGHGWAPME